MVGKWLGCIQPMCSAAGHSWRGPFFCRKSAPFHKKWIFVCCYNKTSLFIIKRPDPGGFASLDYRKGPPLPVHSNSQLKGSIAHGNNRQKYAEINEQIYENNEIYGKFNKMNGIIYKTY